MFFKPRTRRESTPESSAPAKKALDPGSRRALQATQSVIRNGTATVTSASALRAHQVARLRTDGVSVQDIADTLGIQASKVYRIHPDAPEEDGTRSPHWDGSLDPNPTRFVLGYDGQTGAGCTIDFPRWHGTVLVTGGKVEPEGHGGMLAFDALLAQALARPMPWGESIYPEVLYLSEKDGLRRFSGRRGVQAEDTFSDDFSDRVTADLEEIRQRLTERKNWRQAHYPDTQDWSEVPDDAKRDQGFTPLIVACVSPHSLRWNLDVHKTLFEIILELGREGLLCFAHLGVDHPSMALKRANVPLSSPVHSIEFGMGGKSLSAQDRAFRFLDDPEPWAKSASWGLREDEAFVESAHGSFAGLGVRPVSVTSHLFDGQMVEGRFVTPTLDRVAPRGE